MRGNEFEQKVQEQMEDLHFRPSPMVWMEVERELRKKKRRRIVFYLSILTGLGLLGYSGYTLLSQDRDTLASNEQKQNILSPAGKSGGPNDPSAQSSSTEINNNTANNTTTNTTNSKISTIDPSLLNNGTVADSHEKVKQPVHQPVNKATGHIADHPVQRSIPGEKKVNATYSPLKENTNSQLAVTQTSPSIGRKKTREDKPSEQSTPLQKDEVVINDQPEKTISKENSNINDAGITKNIEPVAPTNVPAIDSVKKAIDIAQADLDTDLSDNTKIEKALAKGKSSKKIKWGFDISAGRNLSRAKSFGIPGRPVYRSRFNPEMEDLYKDMGALSTPPQSATSGVVPYSLGGGYVRPPSPVKAGKAVKIGVVAELQLTKRSSVTAGLRYTYLDESIKVGSIIDTSLLVYSGVNNPRVFSNYMNLNAAYLGPGTNMHTNKYHFIELPVSYQLQLNRSKKIAILWNAGMAVSLMLHNTALVYDTAAYGIYFKNPKAISKVHFSVQSGFSVRFGAPGKLQWSIGPETSMDLTRLMRREYLVRDRYFLYGGVTARILLPGKKK